MNNNREIVELLLEHEANFLIKNNENKTCLEIAREQGYDEIKEILEVDFKKELLFRNRNCLVKLYLTKDKSLFKPIPLGVFREIIKYA